MNLFRKSVTVCIRRKKCGGPKYLHQNLFSSIEHKTTEAHDDPVYKQTSDGSPILHRVLDFCPNFLTPREVWVENLDDVVEKKKGLVELHPKVFGVLPRLDIIHENVTWQRKYQNVIVYSAKVTPEMRGGGAKPHPQKGLGRARQGSIRAPQFIHGGTCHGPRNPTSHFYMLPWELRVYGLTSTLSAKLAQDDLHVVDNLDIPTDDKQFVLDLIKKRNWGPSVLIVDIDDIMPRNITLATDPIGHVNLIPAYGLNVVGMLKHDTLVLTLAAVEEIEKRLVTLLNTATPYEIKQEMQKMDEQARSVEKPETPLTLLLKSPQKSFFARSQTPLPLPQSLIVPVTPNLNLDARPAVTLQNVVATVNLLHELDLRKINFCTRNTEYNPARFKGLVMRIREPKTTALIFKSGKIVVTGAKSEDAALLAARKYARIIQKLGFHIKFCNFKVQNIVGTCDVRFPIKLESLNQVHGQFSSYEPELFPALIYRLVKPRVVLLIFVNGKIVLTGARTKQEIQEALDIMLPILKSFRKQ